MGHIASKEYLDLRTRLDYSPHGAPASEAIFSILKVLFSEDEARLVSILPFTFFRAEEAARRWPLNIHDTKKILASLAGKGVLFDLKREKETYYYLTPTMAGFFEFSLMRSDGVFNKKLLSELFYQYLNKEDKLAIQLFSLDPSFGRIIAQEDLMPNEDLVEVLDYEKISHILNTASEFAVGACYCRHKMEHIGRKCTFPQETCITLNECAEVLTKNKIARKISRPETKKIIDNCVNIGLAQFGDNVQKKVNFICNCCPCCCEAANIYKRFYNGSNISASNFISLDNDANCNGCGICAARCPVDAIVKTEIKSKIIYKVIKEKCLGCGVCVRFCPNKAKIFKRRDEINYTPVDMFERMIVSAVNAGKIQNFIFDNSDKLTHRIMRRTLGTILRLPLAKKILAIKQLRSKYMYLAARGESGKIFNRLINNGQPNDYSHKELQGRR